MGSKSEPLQTLVAASCVETAAISVRSSVLMIGAPKVSESTIPTLCDSGLVSARIMNVLFLGHQLNGPFVRFPAL